MKKLLFLVPFLLFPVFVSCQFIDSFSAGDAPITGISFPESNIVLSKGDMAYLPLTADPAGSQEAAGVSWEYDNAVISGQADSYGIVITALSPGETVVKAKTASVTAACMVYVTSDEYKPAVSYPYVYANTAYAELSAGKTVRISASLFGGTSSDMNGFTFSLDNPSIASVYSEGNYCWITGKAEGAGSLAIRHIKANYSFSVLIYCSQSGQSVPYITTPSNIVTINRSTETTQSFSLEMKNVAVTDAAYDDLYAYRLTGADGMALAGAPISINAVGKQCFITPLTPGECFISVTHPDARYPFNVLVRVTENADLAYIEPSASVIQLSGETTEVLHAALYSVPSDYSQDTVNFSWTPSENAGAFVDFQVYNGTEPGKGDSMYVTGKKQGVARFTISHPKALISREVTVIVRSITQQALQTASYISTNQNYIETKVGASDTILSVYLNNAPDYTNASFTWKISSSGADGSHNPVIKYQGGTGTTAAPANLSARILKSRAVTFAVPGYAFITPLRPGNAVITISHPDALYETKVAVTVLPEDSKTPELFALHSDYSYIELKNGEQKDISCSLYGPGVSAADGDDIRWASSSPFISIAPNGTYAAITASGQGSSRETITVTHPGAPYPVTIAMVRYDTIDSLVTHKLLVTASLYHTVYIGDSICLAVNPVNCGENDSVTWNAASGNGTIIAFSQESNTASRVTGLAKGTATVTAALNGTTEKITFSITVKPYGAANEALPSYLSTAQNAVTLPLDGVLDLSVTPVNISELYYTDISWSVDNPALVAVRANGTSASLMANGIAGDALLTVSHPHSQNTLEVHIRVGKDFVYRNTDVETVE
jgi:hypothetical protein